ncbi:MAG: hypothetical protein KAX33_04290 [Candidatus Lokiarchaeota archaeon]|nr:hypothetical protein [Candidatus Lokiarchaeota archaeon]
MKFVEPSFEIDNKGRTMCKNHTYYQFFQIPHKTIYEEKQLEKILTCKACEHYYNNDCYFPSREIDLIERDRQRERIKCVLCGNRIHRLLTIVQSLYYEAKFNVKVPLICCDCHLSLNDQSFMQRTKLRLVGFVISFLISLYLIFYFFLAILAVKVFIIIGLIFLIFWFSMSMKDIKKILYLREGRKYYQKFISQSNVDEDS